MFYFLSNIRNVQQNNEGFFYFFYTKIKSPRLGTFITKADNQLIL